MYFTYPKGISKEISFNFVLAKGSLKFILVPLFLAIVSYYFIHEILGIFVLGIAGYFFWFFRDPTREIKIDKSSIYSAADGKVIEVNIDDELKTVKIAIRMSPFNVHLNRAPIYGSITKITRTPGKHLSVYFGDVEKKNEKNLIVMENEKIYCEVLQITGIFARRIECWVTAKEIVAQGQKIGIIRFGSQTNVVIKSLNETKEIKPNVKVGDKVNAGISILAKIE